MRGIAILIVVLGHAIQINLQDGDNSLFWSKVILSFQMPLLFLISGFTAGYSFPARDTSVFLIKKIRRLLIPYLSWEVLHYLIACAIPGDYRFFTVKGLIMEFFCSDFWFLRYLFVFYLILWICNIIINKINTRNGINLGLVLCLGTVLVAVFGKIPYLKQSVSTWYYLWFAVGLLLFPLQKNRVSSLITKEHSVKTVIFALVGLVAVCFIALYTAVSPRVICVGIVLFLSVFCVSMEKHWPKKIKLFLIQTGNNTLPIYGIHWCLLFSPFFRLEIYKLWSNVPVLLSSIITAIIWMFICVLLIRIGSRNKAIRTMFLGR